MNHSDHVTLKPLHKAAADNDAELVAHLLAKKADINARNEVGYTPLHLAAEKGHMKIVHVLLGHRADVAARDHHGRTPLHIAAQHGATDIVADLLAEGEEIVEAQDVSGQTALHLAAAGGFTDVIHSLLIRKANINARTHLGHTPLHEATEHNFLETVDFLLVKGAHINEGDNFHRTPLHVAAKLGFVDITDLLISKAADINAQDHFGRTPLHEAAMKGHCALVTLLVQKGAQVGVKDLLGRTPFFMAAMSSQRDVMLILRKVCPDTSVAPPPPTAPATSTVPAEPQAAAPHPKPAELELQRLTARVEQQSRMFEEILTAIPDHLYLLDRAGRFTYASLCAAQALGIKQMDFVGKTWQELGIRTDSITQLMRECELVFQRNEAQKGECSLSTTAGIRHFEYILHPIHRGEGEVTVVICAARDITDRKQAEIIARLAAEELERRISERTADLNAANAALQQELDERRRIEAQLRLREEHFRHLADATAVGIVMCEQGVITDTNAQFAAMLGYAPEELLGMTMQTLFVPEDGTSWWGHVTSGQEQVQDYRMRRKDGSTIVMDIHGKTLRHHDQLIRVMVTRPADELSTETPS